MSNRYNNGSHYENHQRAAELHEGAAHAHRVAEQHGKQDHLTGHERSRQALEHSQIAYQHTHTMWNEHELSLPEQRDIAAMAYQLWEARGRPEGSPDEDWFNARNALDSRSA